MSRILVSILTVGLLAPVLCPAEAANRKVRIPDQFDGSWSIDALTSEGPCAQSTHYAVQIRNSDVSYAGDDIGVEGGVSAGGTVNATITKGSNQVPISGSLNRKGTGSGTWRTTGNALIECSGRWSASRTS